MKTLAFNASPLMERGNTALLLGPFLQGMKEAGCDIELFYTCKLHVEPCLGDKACWTRTPGKCVQNDDVKGLLPKLRDSGFIVFATPVFVDGMPGTLKNVIDRLLPLLEPYFMIREDHCRHPPRQPHKHSKVVLLSACGFWEKDNFDPLVMHVKAICKNACREFVGALLRPHAEALAYMIKKGMPVQDVPDAARNAGKEVANSGRISQDKLEIVSRELVPLTTYVEMTNKGFIKALERLNQTKS